MRQEKKTILTESWILDFGIPNLFHHLGPSKSGSGNVNFINYITPCYETVIERERDRLSPRVRGKLSERAVVHVRREMKSLYVHAYTSFPDPTKICFIYSMFKFQLKFIFFFLILN